MPKPPHKLLRWSVSTVCQVQKVLGWTSLKNFERLNVDMTLAVGTFFPSSDKRLQCFQVLRNIVHHLPQNNFSNSCSTVVRRACVMSIFYLQSLKAAVLCKNNSVRRGNIHSDFGGYYECLPGKSLEQHERAGRWDRNAPCLWIQGWGCSSPASLGHPNLAVMYLKQKCSSLGR